MRILMDTAMFFALVLTMQRKWPCQERCPASLTLHGQHSGHQVSCLVWYSGIHFGSKVGQHLHSQRNPHPNREGQRQKILKKSPLRFHPCLPLTFSRASTSFASRSFDTSPEKLATALRTTDESRVPSSLCSRKSTLLKPQVLIKIVDIPEIEEQEAWRARQDLENLQCQTFGDSTSHFTNNSFQSSLYMDWQDFFQPTPSPHAEALLRRTSTEMVGHRFCSCPDFGLEEMLKIREMSTGFTSGSGWIWEQKEQGLDIKGADRLSQFVESDTPSTYHSSLMREEVCLARLTGCRQFQRDNDILMT